jgi:hypothetical protein
MNNAINIKMALLINIAENATIENLYIYNNIEASRRAPINTDNPVNRVVPTLNLKKTLIIANDIKPINKPSTTKEADKLDSEIVNFDATRLYITTSTARTNEAKIIFDVSSLTCFIFVYS